MNRWTTQEEQLLMELYPNHTNQEIALEIGRSVFAIKNRAVKIGLHKSKVHLESRAGRIEKGATSWNKGAKGLCIKGSEKSWFKKGNKPYNYKPVGSTRCINKGYTEIKIADPNRWQFLHRHIWEKAFGQLSRHEVVVFKDGDKTNIQLDNLEKVTRKTNAKHKR